MSIELPQLTVEQKWATAESNMIYFIACGISYAKCHGQTAEDFGVWAGQVAAPSWEEEKSQGLGPIGLINGISHNKQQFRGFEMEILEESELSIRARMKCFGENVIRHRPHYEVSVYEYIRFFEKKWVVIADFLGLEYKQQVDGDWVVFTVTRK
jgi:hypothetical protein